MNPNFETKTLKILTMHHILSYIAIYSVKYVDKKSYSSTIQTKFLISDSIIMKTLFFSILIVILSIPSVAQPYFYFIYSNPVSCNGGSDGFVEIDMAQFYYYCTTQILSVTPPCIFQWSTGQNTHNIYNQSAGVYYLTLTDAAGNQEVIQVTIDEPDSISVEAILINPGCETCPDGSINITVSGGSPPFNYNWSTGDTSQNISNLLFGNYKLTVTDYEGCESSFTYSIIHNPPDTQLIILETGWNMFSTFKEDSVSNIDTFLNSIEGNYSIIKNWEGEVYIPQFGVNTIDTVEQEFGFQIKMLNTDTLFVYGQTISPELFTIELPSGWSMIGYPRYIDGSISEMMDSIINNIIIMKDENGSVYWPTVGLNMIGLMHPGDAFQIKTNSAVMFSYPPY